MWALEEGPSNAWTVRLSLHLTQVLPTHFLSLWALQRREPEKESQAWDLGQPEKQGQTIVPPGPGEAHQAVHPTPCKGPAPGHVGLFAVGTCLSARSGCCSSRLPGSLQTTVAVGGKGCASHELIPLAAGGAMWVQLSHSANTSPHDDLICSLGQLSNPLPRWAPRAGDGTGGCWPIFCLCLSVSLRPVALHSSEKLESCPLSVWTYGPVPAPSGLRFFARTVPFLLHKGPPVQHSRPTEFHTLSGLRLCTSCSLSLQCPSLPSMPQFSGIFSFRKFSLTCPSSVCNKSTSEKQ